MSHYSNPTANAAMGSVDKEIKEMRRRARQLRQLRLQGRLTREALEQANRQFVGIYRRFLLEALRD